MKAKGSLFAVFFILFFSTQFIYANNKKDSPNAYVLNGFYHLKGFINNKYAITMDITVSQGQITGTMYYDKVGEYIDLKGYQNGLTVIIDGQYKGKSYDHFDGIVDNKGIKGTWTNPQTGKSFPFALNFTNENCALVKTYQYYLENTYKGYKAWYSFEGDYPVATPIKNFEDTIIKIALGLPEEGTFEQKIKTTAQKFVEFDKDNPDMLFNINVEIHSSIVYNKNCILVIHIFTDGYYGGAHGINGEECYIFDLLKGSQITYEDVFAVSQRTLLREKIYPKLKNSEQGEGMDETITKDNIPFADTWGFSDTSFFFIYNIYTIGPFAAGPFEADFTLDELRDYLTENFKKRIGLK